MLELGAQNNFVPEHHHALLLDVQQRLDSHGPFPVNAHVNFSERTLCEAELCYFNVFRGYVKRLDNVHVVFMHRHATSVNDLGESSFLCYWCCALLVTAALLLTAALLFAAFLPLVEDFLPCSFIFPLLLPLFSNLSLTCCRGGSPNLVCFVFLLVRQRAVAESCIAAICCYSIQIIQEYVNSLRLSVGAAHAIPAFCADTQNFQHHIHFIIR
mmetsp:Transcript_5033/g.10061  ORF Transcript_5033/g.10061 Transcript_5033/m.10061 type:complete len:213 (+) Transcript_5033:2132-2770(+)